MLAPILKTDLWSLVRSFVRSLFLNQLFLLLVDYSKIKSEMYSSFLRSLSLSLVTVCLYITTDSTTECLHVNDREMPEHKRLRERESL